MEEEELELKHAAKKPRDITKKIKVSASCTSLHPTLTSLLCRP